MIYLYDNENGVETWLKRNSTRFKLTFLSSVEFDTISKASTLLKTFSEGEVPPFSSSRVRGDEIMPGEVIAFTTEQGKRGAFLVVERSGSHNTAGSITLDVKVEKN